MNNLKFDETETGINYSKKSFIYNFLSSMRQKIDDPFGKKRIKNYSFYSVSSTESINTLPR